MGQKYRRKRTVIKNFVRGYRPNELGELQKKVSKAEARQILASRLIARQEAQEAICRSIQARVIADIHAEEDRYVFDGIAGAVEIYNNEQISKHGGAIPYRMHKIQVSKETMGKDDGEDSLEK